MKYLFLAALSSIVLAGCSGQNKTETESPTETVSSAAVLEDAQVASHAVAAAEEKVLHFTGPYDLSIELKSSDHFQTAIMTDNSDRRYELTNVVSASGLKMANEEGVYIHFKNGDGVVEFVKDKPISITEFKSDHPQP